MDESRQLANATILKLLDSDPTGGAVTAELIGDSVPLIVRCPDFTAFEFSRSGHVRWFTT